ncbi:MAG TPA: fenitrothion hydrolase, partial [Actinomycetota bacterium]|nr:fenitrothion hydrolase [Actinomycetota bacterium]
PYPERLGWWPAAAGIAAYGWLENVSPQRDDPSTLAVLALAYAAIQLVGMSLYGVEAWSRRGDGFAVYFRLFAMLSPLAWHDRALHVRRFLSGVTQLRPEPGLVGLVVVAIGVTTFDGLSEGPIWRDVSRNLSDAFTDAGLSAGDATTIAYTFGLALTLLFVLLLYRLGVAGMRSVDRARSTTELARAFAHSLVPIALAYVVAHYFSLLAYEGQRLGYLVSDPLGEGWNVFGTADQSIDYGVVSANGIWYVQVGSLVIGHVAALVLAHDRALAFYRDPQKATSSQYWMLAVMVSFTTLGLYLLSAANQ